jgi:hypothetical protein
MDVDKMKFQDITENIYNHYKYSSQTLNNELRNSNELIHQIKLFDLESNEFYFNVDEFDSLIHKFETNTERILYRIIPLEYIYYYQVGDIYCDKAFLSTSSNRADVINFMKYSEIAFLKITCKPGTHLINMELNPEKSNENEFLLGRNTKFIIKGKKEINDHCDILKYSDFEEMDVNKIIEYELETFYNK